MPTFLEQHLLPLPESAVSAKALASRSAKVTVPARAIQLVGLHL
jgi:hypothetical protein